MLDLKNLASAILEIAEERAIPQEKIVEVITEAIASAYKKEYGKKKQKIKAKLDLKSGRLDFWQMKQVIDESMILSDEEIEKIKEKKEIGEEFETDEGKVRFNPERHILLSEAKEINKDAELGEEVGLPLEEKADFGRIAAQTAKQVILQKIKEIEKEETFKEFKDKEGEVVSGIVQRVEPMAVFFDIGRTSGILPKKEETPGEYYKPGQRLKLFVLKTENTPKGAQIVLSRIYPKLISKLFELEVPEIGTGQVAIRGIAREAGSRSKVAVEALEEGIDPIGSLVGQRGTRIMAVTNELGGEKIDVVIYNENPEKFIANALSPAKVLEVKILPKNKAQAIIPDDQLSLAIGKDGQNVRLAAKLTGWKIDVRSLSQIENTEISEEQSASAEESDTPEVKELEAPIKNETKKPATKTPTDQPNES
ncbi:MAG: transcription termination factor NusA [Candidatus Pacebacteria bacterium]|nr:transcription termination factor NusA [Candidatus Paceibacterota bacterium]